MRILRTTDIAWTAGFLEGEGCFSLGGKSTGISISVPQVNPDPLRRLQNFFGGSISQKDQAKSGFKSQPIFVWLLCGEKAIELAKAVHPYMSEKRQTAIEAMVLKRKKGPGRGGPGKNQLRCARGHCNWGIYPTTKYRFCKTCAGFSRKRYLVRRAQGLVS